MFATYTFLKKYRSQHKISQSDLLLEMIYLCRAPSASPDSGKTESEALGYS